MTTTHEFPDDKVHFTWDIDNEPVLTIENDRPTDLGVVDAGQYIVSALLPLAVFNSTRG